MKIFLILIVSKIVSDSIENNSKWNIKKEIILIDIGLKKIN